MKNFKLSLLPLILMICAQMPAGDLLSEMQTKLDRMEGIYWTAIKMDRKEASYENCRRDLQKCAPSPVKSKKYSTSTKSKSTIACRKSTNCS